MDCIIQVFPDEYHLQTLETLLGACPQLLVSVEACILYYFLLDDVSLSFSISMMDIQNFFCLSCNGAFSTWLSKYTLSLTTCFHSLSILDEMYVIQLLLDLV